MIILTVIDSSGDGDEELDLIYSPGGTWCESCDFTDEEPEERAGWESTDGGGISVWTCVDCTNLALKEGWLRVVAVEVSSRQRLVG
jgi:hypothetical protein